MTDDLEPHLGDHLRHRASRVHAAPDLADLQHRIVSRQRRHTRALGAGLAIALVAGPVLGWSLARSTEPDRDTLTAAGGDGGSTSGGGGGSLVEEGFHPQGSADLDFQLRPVSTRTTEEGIRVVVHSSELGQANGPCIADGIVRIGVNERDLIDVVRLDTAPGGASFLVAGAADARPMWVVAVRGFETVEARFPNGAVDAVDATDGLAVLAAFAPAGTSPQELGDDVIELTGDPMVDMEDSRQARIADGTGGCENPAVPPPVGPSADLTMPDPGEPPADEEGARAEIEAMWLESSDGPDGPDKYDTHERPEVWLDAHERFREEHPEYYEWSKEVYGVVHEIVFTAPDRASVRYSLLSDNPEIPAPGERIGEAVLIDGAWKVSIETACGNVGLAGIECDYSIEG